MTRSAGIRSIARKLARSYLNGTSEFKELMDVSLFTPEEACYFVLLVASYLPHAEIEMLRDFGLRTDKHSAPLVDKNVQTVNA